MNKYILVALCFLGFAVLFAITRGFFNLSDRRAIMGMLRETYGTECCRLLLMRTYHETEQKLANTKAPHDVSGNESGFSPDAATQEASEPHTGEERGTDYEQI